MVLNRVSEISDKKAVADPANKAAYATAEFEQQKESQRETRRSPKSSARSSVFDAANQSLSQQELADIMFASVRKPA